MSLLKDAARPRVWFGRLSAWIGAHRRVVFVLRLGVALAVVLYLAMTVARIGWSDVMHALPADPRFYLLFLLIHFIPPLSEVAIFRPLWRSRQALLPALLHKRVLNDSVLDYTGDAFLALWARGRIADPPHPVVATVKDSAILSGLSSNLATVVLLGGLLGYGALVRGHQTQLPAGLIWAGVLALVLVLVVVLFGRAFLALPRSEAVRVATIHGGRVVLLQVLQAVQWSLAIPGTPLFAWLTFLTARLVLTRIPFLPVRDVSFAGLAVAMGGVLDAPSSRIAAMFLANAALALAINLATVLVTSYLVHRQAARPQGPQKSPRNT